MEMEFIMIQIIWSSTHGPVTSGSVERQSIMAAGML